MSGSNNPTFAHWKQNVSLDLVSAAGANYSSVLKMVSASGASATPISMATLTALPSHADHLNVALGHGSMAGPPPTAHLFSPAASIRHHGPQTTSQQADMMSPDSPSLAHHQLDVYSQLGMQRLGQLYKSNVILNNNNTIHSKHSDSMLIKHDTSNVNNVQNLVESAIR